MIRQKTIIRIFLILLLSLTSAGAWTNTRARAESLDLEEVGLEAPLSPHKPRRGVEQALGFYSHGTLINASKFPLEGDGFLKLFRPRDRGYATADMLQVVTQAAARLQHDYPNGERVQIGDVCAQHGGRITFHQSHQNGLDADIVYMRMNKHEQDPNDISGFDEVFVQDGKISPNFDEERVWAFVKALHDSGRVRRIFMDPVVKETLCAYARKTGEYESQADVLRRIRLLPNHQDHMHVRLACPDSSPSCQAQEEPPEGTGCSESFSN